MESNSGKIVYSSTADFLKYLSDRKKDKESKKPIYKTNNKRQYPQNTLKQME